MTENKIFTVKDLKELLNSLDDNAQVFLLHSDHDRVYSAMTYYEIYDTSKLVLGGSGYYI